MKKLNTTHITIKKGAFITSWNPEIGKLEYYILGKDLEVATEAPPEVHNMEMSHLYRETSNDKQDIDF